jgi:hypothetical protein
VNSISRASEWQKLREEKKRSIEALLRTSRLKRATIQLMGGSPWSKKLLYRLNSKAKQAQLQKIHQQYRRDRQRMYEKYRRRAWCDWLQEKAIAGDNEALTALRARQRAESINQDALAGNAVQSFGPVLGVRPDSVTRTGTINYRVFGTAIRDDGTCLQVSRGATPGGLEAALRMATHRYGERISVAGTPQFKERIAQIAASAKLSITFDDAALNSRCQALRSSSMNQERDHDRQEHGRKDRPRASGARSTAGGRLPVRTTASGARRHAKPHIASVGAAAPPEAQNRLRGLSQLGVVRLASGSEVLLPRDVPGVLEHSGTQSDHAVRRGVYRPAGLTPAHAAAEQFIAEREAKRLRGLDVAKHTRYSAGDAGVASYAGTRRSEGHFLALLKRAEVVTVMPIDETTARRLKRLTVGEPIVIIAKGAIKRRGRGR